MHCRFAKGILSYIPPVESHVLRHGQTPTRRFEHKTGRLWTGNANTLHTVQGIIEIYNIC